MLLYKYIIVWFFWLTLSSFFFLNYVKFFLSTVTMIVIIIINVKNILRDFHKQFSTTLGHCKARHVLRDLFSTNQGNVSDTTFVAGA